MATLGTETARPAIAPQVRVQHVFPPINAFKQHVKSSLEIFNPRTTSALSFIFFFWTKCTSTFCSFPLEKRSETRLFLQFIFINLLIYFKGYCLFYLLNPKP